MLPFWLAQETTECVSIRFRNSSRIWQLTRGIEVCVQKIDTLKPSRVSKAQVPATRFSAFVSARPFLATHCVAMVYFMDGLVFVGVRPQAVSRCILFSEAILLSVMLITLLIVKFRQARPEPETDLELGALPAAAILSSSTHSVWSKEVSHSVGGSVKVSEASEKQASEVPAKPSGAAHSRAGDVGDVFLEPAASEDSEGQLRSPKGGDVFVPSGTLHTLEDALSEQSK